MRASPAGPTNGALDGNEAGAERLVAYQKFLRRGDISLTHTIVQPTVDKATRRRAGGRQRRTPCARSPTPSTASSCAARACWRPWRRSPTSSRSIRPRRCPQGADAYALSFCIPMGAPGLKFLCRDSVSSAGQPLRPSAVEPLRRAGRLRDLRRRRGAARPPVHRLQPRRLQHGDDHELAAEHPAADDDPRLGEARLRLGPGAAHGGRDQRRRSRDHAHDRRDLELCGVHARRRRRGRGRGARMAGRPVDLRAARAAARAARHRCRCGSRG